MNDASHSANMPAAPEPVDLHASWARSQRHGLRQEDAPFDALICRADLRDRLEANARLLTFSRPVIENLFQQIDCPSSTVLLTDEHGLILSAIGDTRFLDRASRVSLGPGATWTEATMGTNAIGTALVTHQTVAVEGAQHYLERNRFLTCVATPIFAPDGGVAGILDISTDARANLSHADALLRTTAECIEHRLIESLDDGFLAIHFHVRPDLLGSPLEALAIFDESGRLLASNRAARALLHLQGEYPQTSCDESFTTRWQGLVDWAAFGRRTPFPLRTRHGQTCIALVDLRARSNTTSRPGAANPAHLQAAVSSGWDAMPGLDTRITHAIEAISSWHAERAAGPLLLAGETGTGKRHLLHLSRQRFGIDSTLISLDCRALASSPLLDSEIDHALRQAQGGTLYLTDIDAMPIAAQSRLFAAAGATTRIVAATRCPLDVTTSNWMDRTTFEHHQGRTIELPPLRERSDFDALVRYFVRSACTERTIHVCPDALALLRRNRWPGNLSELNNRLRLILALMGDDAGQLGPEDIPEELLEAAGA